MLRCTATLLQLFWQLSGGGAPQAELKGHTQRRPATQAPYLDCVPSRRRRGIAALQLQLRASGSPRAAEYWSAKAGAKDQDKENKRIAVAQLRLFSFLRTTILRK